MTRLRLYRLLRELTQEELAQAIGKSQPQLLRYERGELPVPAELLPQLARVLKVPEEALAATGAYDVITVSSFPREAPHA